VSELLPPRTPAQFEARNLRPKFRRLKAGDIFLAEIEVEEAVWNQLRTVPENALLEITFWHHDGDPDPKAKPEKESKGPHSKFWEVMFRRGFNSSMDLMQTLGVDEAKEVGKALHTELATSTLSLVSPEEFEKWADSNALTNLVAMSRQIRAESSVNER
jgi:hypothetical protein